MESLFSKPAIQVKNTPDTAPTKKMSEENIKKDENQESEAQNAKPWILKNMSAAQIKDREDRTVFVGNVPLDTKRKTLKKFFEDCGQVETVWLRSVPIENKYKGSIKGHVITKKFKEGATNCNAYVQFTDKVSVQKALEKSNMELKGRHVHVTLANQKEVDTKTTIFVGNQPFNADEEEIRKYFQECGTIDYIRVVRDPRTHNGKGICYIKFAEQTGYLQGLRANNHYFRDRQIRVSKAIVMGEDKKPASRKEARPRWTEEQKDIAKKMRGNLNKEEKQNLAAFTEAVTQKEEMFDMDQENIVEEGIGMTIAAKVPSSLVRKQIKKVKNAKLDQDEAVAKVNKIVNRHHKKLDDNVFRKGDELKARRIKRKAIANQNAKKAHQIKRLQE